MCFQEVKSMLRMINIDMNDIYAYKLFKVPALRPVTRRPRSAVTWLRARWLRPCPPLPNAEDCQTHGTLRAANVRVLL